MYRKCIKRIPTVIRQYKGRYVERRSKVTAVADSASRLGRIIKSRYAIDCHYLWSAALHHDIGRYVTHDPIMHGVEGYNLLIAICTN